MVKNPKKVAEYPLNQLASMWFWDSRNLNALADRDDVLGITKRVNGGTNGLANRQYLLRKFKKEFGI